MTAFIVSDSQSHKRLDVVLTEVLKQLNRSIILKLIKTNKVKIEGETVSKSGYKLRDGQRVQVDTAIIDAIPENINLNVIYIDDDVVVVEKPEGLLSHSKGSFNSEPTVATFIKQYVVGLDGDRAGIVHRLDRATSGVMICARNPAASSWLQKQFSTRKVKKTYMAVVNGVPKENEAIIDMPIARNAVKPQTFHVSSNGKNALTKYKLVKSNGLNSLLELTPTTGRTHQLRVHLSKIEHPIVGDTVYGQTDKAKRMFLHATSLEITLPNKKRTTFTSSLPFEFNKCIS